MIWASIKPMKRWKVIVAAIVVILGIVIIAGYRVGVRMLQEQVVQALGPGSRLSEIKVNWFSVEVLGLSIDAPKGWPAARTLEAERIIIFPDLRSLLGNKIRIASIVVEKPYLSVLRNPGKLILVPSLTERYEAKKDTARKDDSRAVVISKIELNDGTLEFYDATVSRPPLKTRMERIEAVIEDVGVPAADKTRFELAGIVKGLKSDGHAKVDGWIGPAARDSSSRVVLKAVDLVALQPYLVKKTEARVSNGTLDLNLGTEVRNKFMNGKGKIILQNLEFARSTGFFDTFMGVPRNAVVNFLRDHNNAIDVDFTLTGDTSNPNFSLNENLSTRIATAMAGQLGVNIRDVAEGLGTLGRKGIEGASGVVEGVGSAVKRLFGGQ
jgi:hypothetical protein